MIQAFSSASRVRRVFHELRIREVEVARVELLGRGFRAVTFRGEALADFVSSSFDDHVKFIVTDEAGAVVRRDYTPRRFDPAARELTIEFGLRGGGAASAWASWVEPGARATIGGPRGSMVIPADYPWHLLAGDAAALPAIHRRLEELPATARAIVRVRLDDEEDRREFTPAARLDVRWCRTDDELVEELRAFALPAGEGFAWCAGEATLMARLRTVLVEEKRLPRQAMRVAVYWKRGASDFHESLVNPIESL